MTFYVYDAVSVKSRLLKDLLVFWMIYDLSVLVFPRSPTYMRVS